MSFIIKLPFKILWFIFKAIIDWIFKAISNITWQIVLTIIGLSILAYISNFFKT